MGRAIVRNPKAFLMDEPLSNLDAKLRVQMRAEVARIQHRLNTTTVYVTHDQTEAMTLGDRVAIMLSGELQQVASPMELYNNPANLFVAGFIGSPGMNFLPATIDGDTAKLPMVDGQAAAGGARADRPRRRRQEADRRHPAGGLRGRGAGAGRDAGPRDHVQDEVRPRRGDGRGVLRPLRRQGRRSCRRRADGALLEDQGGVAESEGRGRGRRRRPPDAESRAKTGEPTEVWLDATKMHFFDADSGRVAVV